MSLARFLGTENSAEWTRPSVLALIAANLLPALGVLVLGWEVFPLLFLFWSENVIVGGFNALKMLLAAPANPLGWAAKLFMVPFFCVHYGGFTLIHGFFVIALFGNGDKLHMQLEPPGFSIIGQLARGLGHIAVTNGLVWAILGLAASHGISFATNYLANGEYKRASLDQLMQQPYGRILVLHFTILIGGFLVMALHSPMMGLLLLIALKTALDLRGHLKERTKFAATISPANNPSPP